MDLLRQVETEGWVPGLIRAQAERTPEALALRQGSVSLSYRELDQRSSELACTLRSLGVGADAVVGLHLPRSVAFVVAALGVWRAGGAYLPLDPSYPQQRLAFLRHDAQARILVSSSDGAQNLALPTDGTSGTLLILDPEGHLPVRCRPPLSSPIQPAGDPIKPANLAYVIYTSGSSGEPKGVELTHAGLLNLVLWHRQAFQIRRHDRASQLMSVSFDAAVWELWPYLASGASVHIADHVAIHHPEAVRDWLLSQAITIGFVPAPLAERLITLEWPRRCSLRVMLTGADTLHHGPVRRLPFQLVNNYGPTECTVVATSAVIPPDDHPERPPTIGRPISQTQIHILDEMMQPVPVGAVGEIYIGGAGVARGYRNRPELTEQTFVPDLFTPEPGARLYRSGDLGRLLPDGQIAFLGRTDEQIKIRGYRIEPAEIVRVLDAHPAVQSSLVLARELDQGERQLVAYVVLAPGPQPAPADIRRFLASHLPPHMIPAIFVTLAALPLTRNGKVDRTALPAPSRENTLYDRAFTAPRSRREAQLAELVAGLLGLSQLSIDDNFFLLGGDSLLGTRLIAALNEAFGIELGLLQIFESPTVAALAADIEARLAALTGAGPRAARPYDPLTLGQPEGGTGGAPPSMSVAAGRERNPQ